MADTSLVADASHDLATHQVLNQATAFEGADLLEVDPALSAHVERLDARWLTEQAASLGRFAGSPRAQQLARQANAHPPVLHAFDRFGRRRDEIAFHPAYHDLMDAAMRHEVPSCAWNHERVGHSGFVALAYLFGQAEAGVLCPMTMTYAAAPTLKLEPALNPLWLNGLKRPVYDPRFLPADQKRSLTFGMAMTEKQGGSDVRANTTVAEALDRPGRAQPYLLTGHKWFCSAPMSDAFLTLAQAQDGLSCFLVPRFRPDGSRNPLLIQRLKEKLGNRSNASSEIDYSQTYAELVGEEGHGVRTIIEMVRHTRLACVTGSASLMRQALTCAVHHARGRSAFGRPLYSQPLMRQVLADLTLESEAALHLAMRLGAAFDAQARDEHERALARLGVTIAKYWVCKRAPSMTYEAMECLGGAGYVEESPMPRIFRESPLNSIWEGSGNIMALDLLRAMRREPESLQALFTELGRHAGRHPHLDAAIKALHTELAAPTEELEARARFIAERMALCLQAASVAEYAPTGIFEAFVSARLGPDRGHTFGALPRGLNVDAILARSLPSS